MFFDCFLMFLMLFSRLNVIYLLPESGGRLPDGTRVLLQDLSIYICTNLLIQAFKGKYMEIP